MSELHMPSAAIGAGVAFFAIIFSWASDIAREHLKQTRQETPPRFPMWFQVLLVVLSVIMYATYVAIGVTVISLAVIAARQAAS